MGRGARGGGRPPSAAARCVLPGGVLPRRSPASCRGARRGAGVGREGRSRGRVGWGQEGAGRGAEAAGRPLAPGRGLRGGGRSCGPLRGAAGACGAPSRGRRGARANWGGRGRRELARGSVSRRDAKFLPREAAGAGGPGSRRGWEVRGGERGLHVGAAPARPPVAGGRAPRVPGQAALSGVAGRVPGRVHPRGRRGDRVLRARRCPDVT